MKLIKLTKPIFKLGECIDKITIYINIDHISAIEEKEESTTIKTVILLNNEHAIEVCEDIEEVIRRIHLQTIKWKDGQFFINGEPQELTYTYEQGLKTINNQIWPIGENNEA
jgi:uncharacterized protein YlzI (FlbEa/FlbD family)